MPNPKSKKQDQKKIHHRILDRIEPLRKRIHSFRKTVVAIAEMVLQNLFPQFSFKRFWKDLKRKPVFWVAVSAVGLVILFLILKNLFQSNLEEVAVVERGNFAIDLIEAGDVEAVNEKVVSAPQTWLDQIQVIDLVPEGTVVKKGDFLAQFDIGDLDDQKIVHEAEVASAQADYQKLIAQQSLALHSLENNLKLNEYSNEQAKLKLEMSQFESEAKKEEARLQLKQAEISLKSMQEQLTSMKIIQGNQRIQTEAKIRNIQNHIRQLNAQIALMRVIAPEEGMVIYKDVGSWRSRERLKTGYKAMHGEPILSVPDMSHLRIKIFINEADRSEVLPGQKALITLDAYPKSVFHGRVQTVSRLAQSVRWNSLLKGFAVLVNVVESDRRIKPGMSARVHIVMDSLKNVLTVPVGVVFEMNEKPVVFPRGRTKPVYVTLGPRNDERIVIQKGVKAGQKLSWHPVNPQVKMFGNSEEKRRINVIAANLEQSLSNFEKSGTIYDYANPNRARQRRMQDRSGSPGGEDMLRQLMRQRRSGTSGEGSSGGGEESMRLTPEMRDRIQVQSENRQGGDSTRVRQRSQRRAQGQEGLGQTGQTSPDIEGGGGDQQSLATPEMTQQFRQMRQRRQGGDSTGTRRRFQGSDSSGVSNRQFQVTPEMRERFRQMRQRQGGQSPAGAPPDSGSGRQSGRRNAAPSGIQNQ